MAANSMNNSNAVERSIEPLYDARNNILRNSNNCYVFVVKPDGIIFTIPAGCKDGSANTSLNSTSSVETEEEVHLYDERMCWLDNREE